MHRRFGWFATDDLSLLVEQCEFWNKDRLYEILWEYSGLSPTILRERGARGWLYHENGELAGFALGRERLGWWEMEELWGPAKELLVLTNRLMLRTLPDSNGSEDFS